MGAMLCDDLRAREPYAADYDVHEKMNVWVL